MTVTTEHFYSGNNSTTSFAYTFPYYKTSDIKVKVGGTLKTESTHYNITGTNVVFTSGNVPPNGTNNIHIYRETDVDTSKATFAAGSSIRATDLNNNETQLLYHAQEQNFNKIQTADIEDKAITSDKILDGTIATADIADNAVTAAKLATNSIDATNLAANSVGASEIADNAVDTAAIADDAVTSAKIATGAVIADSIGTNAVTTAKIYNEAVETAKIDDGAVTTAKINNAAVTADKLGTDSVITAKILDANVTTNKIANDSVTADKLANSINAEIAANTAKTTNATHTGEVTGATSLTITNSAVVTDRIADDAVTAAKLANSINAEIAANTAKTSNVTHTGEVTGSGALTIANDAVTTAKIADNAVTTAKIADAELSTLAGMQSGTASILADSTALTSTTAELNLLDGKSIVTSVSGSSTDVQLPTAKAVNDQIVALMQAAGGYYPIADEVSFPNANPDPNNDAGTIVSIADAGGVVVNGSGVSTTGRTLGGATVTINGIDSSLNSTTIAAGKGMLVQTTSTLNTYTYHRLVLDESGVASAQTLVSDFNGRYRVGASNPTSSLDDGDLFFNTSSNKMLVYNDTGSSWDEVQSVGNFYINTISSYSGTGGNSASFNGSAYRFVLSNAPTYAQQLIVSVNGVLQKPNAGTSQPSEGFVIDGSSIIFSTAPASGADYFIVTIGAAVNIGAPSDNQVSTASLQNSSVTTAKIADDAVTADKLANSINTEIAANTAKTTNATHSGEVTGATALTIADDVVDEANLKVDNTPTNDYVLTAKSSAAGGLTWAATASGVGGATGVDFNDNVKIRVGTGNDLELYHDGSNSYVSQVTAGQNLFLKGDAVQIRSASNEQIIETLANGAVKLYYDNSKKFETNSSGVAITGSGTFDAAGSNYLRIGSTDASGATLTLDGDSNGDGSGADYCMIKHDSDGDLKIIADNPADAANTIFYSNANTERLRITSDGKVRVPDNGKFVAGAGDDLSIYHDGSHSIIEEDGTGALKLVTNSSLQVRNGDKDTGEYLINANVDGSTTLYYDGVSKVHTNSSGVDIGTSSNACHLMLFDGGEARFGTGQDLVIKHTSTNSLIKHNGTGDLYIDSYAKDIYLRTGDGSSGVVNAISCQDNAQVELYHSGIKQLLTTSDGIEIKPDVEGSNAVLYLTADQGDDNLDKWAIKAASDGTIYHQNYTSGSFVTKFETRAGGDIKVNNGNILMGTAGTGINFSATSDGSGASNVNEILDDYEEGTFTPTLRSNGNSTGQVTGSGTYVKIGKQVHITVNLGNKTLTSLPAGTVQIVGLPFVANHTTGDEFGMSTKMIVMGVDSHSEDGYFRTNDGQDYLFGYYNTNGAVWSAWNCTDWDNSGVYCIFNMTYFTNS